MPGLSGTVCDLVSRGPRMVRDGLPDVLGLAFDPLARVACIARDCLAELARAVCDGVTDVLRVLRDHLPEVLCLLLDRRVAGVGEIAIDCAERYGGGREEDECEGGRFHGVGRVLGP